MEFLPSAQPRLKTREDSRRNALMFVLVVAILAGAIILGFLQLRQPKVVSSSGPANQFSAERAYEQLKQFAVKPHPLGSQEHDRVRDYLIDQLEQLGLKPEIQKSNSLRVTPRWHTGGNIENIIAKIEGTDSTKAVMIVAHYDSVTGGPGAADDGAGVAAILETARALKESKPLKNDVIILLTDGEENGLLGAKAFVDENPLAKEVGLVLNFEARGNEGPSIMFETSDNNSWLVKEFVKAVPTPVAQSIVYSMYKLMPNDTDLTVFKEGGLTGLNFAVAMGLDHYHTTSDNLEKVSLSSIQHHGENMLSLVQHFGNLNLAQTHKGNEVFFNILGSKMISYSENLVVPLMLIVLLLFVATMVHGVRKKKLSIVGTLGSVFIFIVGMIGAFGIGQGLWSLLFSIFKNQQWLLIGGLSVGAIFLIGFALIVFAFLNTLYLLVHKKLKTGNLMMGALFTWLVLVMVTSLLLKAGSYVFTWPLLFALIGMNLNFRSGDKSQAIHFSAAIFAIPAFLMFAPIVFIVSVMASFQMANVLMVLVSLLGAMLVPIFCRLKIKSGWVMPVIFLVAGIAVLAVNSINVSGMPTAKNTEVSDIAYFMDADTNKAYWASRMPLDEHTSQYISKGIKKGNTSEFFPLLNWNVSYTEADTYNLKAPDVTVVSDKQDGDKRTIEYLIKTNRSAEEIAMKSLTDMEISKLLINGKESRIAQRKFTKDEPFVLDYIVGQTGQMSVTVTVAAKDTVKWVVADRVNGVPEPKGTVPSKYSTFGDLSFVMRTIEN